MRKQTTDPLRGDREADQHLCFHYIDSKIPLLSVKMQLFFHKSPFPVKVRFLQIFELIILQFNIFYEDKWTHDIEKCSNQFFRGNLIENMVKVPFNYKPLRERKDPFAV